MAMAQDSGEAPAAGPTKPCRVCALPIPAAARKCTECDSFQDWRGGFSVSTTMLSLIIAVVTSTAAAIPAIRDATALQDSDISIRYLSRNRDFLSFAAVNQGTKAGFVSGGRLCTQAGRGVTLQEGSGRAFSLVPGGEVVELRFRVHSQSKIGADTFMRRVREAGQAPCRGFLAVSNFRATTEEAEFDVPRRDAFLALHQAAIRGEAINRAAQEAPAKAGTVEE